MLRKLTQQRLKQRMTKLVADGSQSLRLSRPICRDSSILTSSCRCSLGCMKLVQNAIPLEIATSTSMNTAPLCCSGCSVLVDTIVKVSRLAWLPKSGGKMNYGYRLQTQFEIFRGTVSRVDVTGSKPKGEADECVILARTVEADRCYLMDRGYAKFTLWNDIHAVNSSCVCRVRDNSVYEVIEEKLLTAADRKACVISDQIVKFGGSKADNAPDHTVRLVTVSASEHKAEWSRNPDLHGDHRVTVDSDSHGRCTDEANIRNDLPLHVRLGVSGSAGTAY